MKILIILNIILLAVIVALSVVLRLACRMIKSKDKIIMDLSELNKQ